MPLSTAVPSTSPPTSVPDAAPSGVVTDPRRRRLILIAMCTALVAVVASVSGLNVAQQSLAVDLGASQSTLLWIINGYTLALAVAAHAVRRGRGPVGPQAAARRRPRVVRGRQPDGRLRGHVERAPVLTRHRRCGGRDDHARHPFGDHLELPDRGEAACDRAVGRVRGRGRHHRPVHLLDRRRQLHVAVGLRRRRSSSRSVRSCWRSRASPNTREARTGRFDLGGSVLSALAIGAFVLGIHEGPEHGWRRAADRRRTPRRCGRGTRVRRVGAAPGRPSVRRAPVRDRGLAAAR